MSPYREIFATVWTWEMKGWERMLEYYEDREAEMEASWFSMCMHFLSHAGPRLSLNVQAMCTVSSLAV